MQEMRSHLIVKVSRIMVHNSVENSSSNPSAKYQIDFFPITMIFKFILPTSSPSPPTLRYMSSQVRATLDSWPRGRCCSPDERATSAAPSDGGVLSVVRPSLFLCGVCGGFLPRLFRAHPKCMEGGRQGRRLRLKNPCQRQKVGRAEREGRRALTEWTRFVARMI